MVEEPNAIGGLPLSPREILGVYENEEGSLENAVLVSTTRLYLRREQEWSAIPYETISEVLGPGEADPRDANGVSVRRIDNTTTVIPVRGGNDQFRDALGVHALPYSRCGRRALDPCERLYTRVTPKAASGLGEPAPPR